MSVVTQFGLSLGLAGAAGVRAYFPLMILGLLTRFAGTPAYRPPFRIMAAVPVLLLLIALAAFELTGARGAVWSANQAFLVAGLRVISGAVIFAGLFAGLGTLGGLFFGGAVAFSAYLILVHLAGRSRTLSAGSEETAAITVTLLSLLLPWSSYFIWGLVFFVLLKKPRRANRPKTDAKTRFWR